MIKSGFNIKYPEKRQAKGRNLHTTDMLRVEHQLEPSHSVILTCRVVSTGEFNHAWIEMPADPDLLIELAGVLLKLAKEVEHA